MSSYIQKFFQCKKYNILGWEQEVYCKGGSTSCLLFLVLKKKNSLNIADCLANNQVKNG